MTAPAPLRAIRHVWRAWPLLLALPLLPAQAQTQAQPPAAPAAAASAPTAAPLPAELFFKPPDFTEAKLSPSGRRVALASTVGDGVRIGLYVWDLDARRPLRPVALFNDADVVRFEWVGDDRLLFSVLDLATGSGEQRAPGLYSVRADGEEMRLLVMRRGMTRLSGRGALAPNHVLLHVPASGDEVIVGELIGRRDAEATVRPLWQNVVAGHARPMRLGAPDGAGRWLFDSRGEARVAVVQRDERRQVHWRAPGSDDWRLIDDSPLLQLNFVPLAVEDNGGLLVLRRQSPDGFAVLARFDFASGQADPRPLVEAGGFDLAPHLVIDAGRLLGVRTSVDAETTVWFDPALRRLQQLADERLPGYVNRIDCRRCGRPDMVALVHSWSARDPGRLWLHEAESGRWHPIGAARPEIDPQVMADLAFVTTAARDGRRLPLWLTLPPGRTQGSKGPGVVLAHDGPWARGGDWRWHPFEQFLASRGYVVIKPEYRGSAGYGEAHWRAGFRQWGRAMQDDLADAVRWATERGLVDRVCIVGGGYGGYATLIGLANDPALYRCGVAWSAYVDLFALLQGSWWTPDAVSPVARRYALPEMVGDPRQPADAEMLKSVDPLHQVARIRAPLLLAGGELDRQAPLRHAERLRQALREAGRDPEWVVYPEEGHEWLKTANRIDFARRVEAFLARHLAP